MCNSQHTNPLFSTSFRYLYAYLCYLDEITCLILISTVRNSEKFYELADWKNRIEKSLRAAGALQAISNSVARQCYHVRDLGLPGLISFLYRHNALNQFTMPATDPPYDKPAEQVLFHRAHSTYKSLTLQLFFPE